MSSSNDDLAERARQSRLHRAREKFSARKQARRCRKFRERLTEAAEFSYQGDYEETFEGFSQAWAFHWIRVGRLLRTFADITSVDQLSIPPGDSYAVAANLLAEVLPGEPAPGFEERLRLAVCSLRPEEEWRHDPSEDTWSGLRDVFEHIRDGLLEQHGLKTQPSRSPETPPVTSAPPITEQATQPTQAEPDDTSIEAEDRALGVAVGPDCIWIIVHGERYAFSPGHQSAAVKCLVDCWRQAGRRDGCGMRDGQIADRVGALETFRVDKVFRGHPALRSIICKVGPRTWAFCTGNDPSERAQQKPRRNPS